MLIFAKDKKCRSGVSGSCEGKNIADFYKKQDQESGLTLFATKKIGTQMTLMIMIK